MRTLNLLQLEILKLFSNYSTEEELLDLKKALITYLSKQTVKSADEVFDSKNYNRKTIELWHKEHNRLKK
ncbi:MAG: hypothetical protein SH857_13900 [Chitinophagales bacterium]|nr:hypothetical protein [Chitinophagales bacterium]